MIKTALVKVMKCTKSAWYFGDLTLKNSILQSRIGKSHPNIFWRLLIETAIVKQYEMQPIVHDSGNFIEND